MDELRRQDLRRFGLGLLRWPSIGLLLIGLAVLASSLAALTSGGGSRDSFGATLLSGLVLVGFGLEAARKWSKAHEFRSPKFRYLWKVCEERLARFEEARIKHRRTDLPELTEMPIAVRGVAQNLRLALRRADVLLKEVEASEGALGLQGPPPIPGAMPMVAPSPFATPLPPELLADRDTNSLYQLADRNVAEYRAGLHNLLAGVARTEAQAAVFATTLDTLRLKMLGYRLGTRRPEIETQEFVGSIHEAKLQMNAIDRALEDLEVNVFARPFTPVGGPIVSPEEVYQHLGEPSANPGDSGEPGR